MTLVGALCLLLAPATSAGRASSTPPPGGPQPAVASGLYVVPTGAASRAALENPAVRAVTHYEGFLVAEAAPADARAFVAAGAVRRDDMRSVMLQRRSVDPAHETALRRDRGERTGLPRGQGPVLVVVQFVGPLKDDWLARLSATGVQVVSYLAENAELVHADGAERAALEKYVAEASEVRGAFVLRGDDKIAPGVSDTGRTRVAIQTLTGEPGAQARDAVLRAAPAVAPSSRVGPYTTLRANLDADQLAALAALPGVVAIEAERTPRLLDERQGLILSDGDIGASPGAGYLAAHDAALFGPTETPATLPFVVDVTDTAIGDGTTTATSADLREDGADTGASRLAYIHKLTSDTTDPPDNQGCDGHGMINASILAGFNDGAAPNTTDSGGFRYGLGIEPRALLGGTTLFGCNRLFDAGGKTFSQIAEDSYLASGAGHDGARIVNNSWGAPDSGGAYDAIAQEFDAIVRDAAPSQPGAQQLVEVVAAGNQGPGPGTVQTPGTAKNVITVGASENERSFGVDGCGAPNSEANNAQDLAAFSGRGPTVDGRIKPDVVAPGTHVSGLGWRATGSSFDGKGICGTQPSPLGVYFPGTAYSASSGTSHATPAVSGLAAAARSAYERQTGSWPSAAMVKAMLVGGATSLSGSGSGVAPGADQGFGLARLAGASTAGRWFDDEPTIFKQSGESSTRTFDVTSAAQPVRVTLAWTDAPGPLVGASYVNNLDLEVTGAGVMYRGNRLVGGVSVPGGTADPRNNVESIVVPAGELDSLAVRVRATNIGGDGVPGGGVTDQDYALVVSNVGAPTGRAALAAQATFSDEDGDGVLEPREAFNVSASVTNTGPVPSAPVTGTLTSGTAGILVADSSASFGALGPGVGAAADGPFGGERAANGCAETPLVSLALSASALNAVSGASTLIVPGAGSTPRDATLTPGVAIPDGNAAWTSIPLSLGDAGVVEDLDLKLTRIDHDWVADLEIGLRAPDGTTVLLIDNAGGSGRDYHDTILDDEAAVPIQSATAANAPFSGRWRPAQPLDTFDGKPLAGTWNLRVRDLSTPDPGIVHGFALMLPACNVAPSAALSVTPASLTAGDTVTLDASKSSDRDDPITEYRWDFDGSGTVDSVTAAPQTSFAAGAAGTFAPAVTVVDARGESSKRSGTIQVLPPPAAPGPPDPPPASIPPAGAPPQSGTSPPTTGPAQRKRLTVRGLPLSRSCPRPRSRRVRVLVSPPRGTRLRNVSVMVGRGLRSKAKGNWTRKQMSLGRQPAGKHTVKVIARTTRGETLRYTKRFSSCLSRR